MKVRAANLNDLPGIMVFSRRACESSPTYGPMGFNAVIWRRTLVDNLKDPTAVVLIAVEDGVVHGILVGNSGPMPWCSGFSASDLVFVAERGGDLLLREFRDWCAKRRVRRIDMGISDTGITDEDGECVAADVMFRREGFSKAGRMYFHVVGGSQ